MFRERVFVSVLCISALFGLTAGVVHASSNTAACTATGTTCKGSTNNETLCQDCCDANAPSTLNRCIEACYLACH